MKMPNRYGGTNDHRYGFNGMEGDDEVKGNKNHLDFGARCYDPRVGRWLSRDALATQKADLSPYQSFKNNPLVYVDPDGKDEWQVVKIVNSKGEQLARVAWKKSSTALMSDGIHHVGYGPLSRGFNQSFGFDFKHVMTIEVTDDFQVKKTTMETMLIKENGCKDRRTDAWTIPFDGTPKEKGEIYDAGFEQPGGLYITGSNGEGTKYYSKNTGVFGNIDLLLGISSAATTKLTPTKEAFSEFMVGQAMDALVKLLFSEDGMFPNDQYKSPTEISESLINDLKKKKKNSEVQVIQPVNRNGVVTNRTWKTSKQDAELYNSGTFNDAGDTLTMPTVDESTSVKQKP